MSLPSEWIAESSLNPQSKASGSYPQGSEFPVWEEDPSRNQVFPPALETETAGQTLAVREIQQAGLLPVQADMHQVDTPQVGEDNQEGSRRVVEDTRSAGNPRVEEDNQEGGRQGEDNQEGSRRVEKAHRKVG